MWHVTLERKSSSNAHRQECLCHAYATELLPLAGIVFGADCGGAGGGGAEDPGGETLDGDDYFAVAGDDLLALAFCDGSQNFAHRFWRGHHHARRDWILRVLVTDALIVNLANFAGDEARTDQRHFHAGGAQLGSDRVGEGAQRELTHRVRRRARCGNPT